MASEKINFERVGIVAFVTIFFLVVASFVVLDFQAVSAEAERNDRIIAEGDRGRWLLDYNLRRDAETHRLEVARTRRLKSTPHTCPPTCTCHE